MQVTLEGKLNPATGYLRNIKDIDQAIRENVISIIRRPPDNTIRPGSTDLACTIFRDVFRWLSKQCSPETKFMSITLWLTPFLSTQLSPIGVPHAIPSQPEI